MVKDGEDAHGFQTMNFKNASKTLQDAQTVTG